VELKKYWAILRRRWGYFVATWLGIVLLTVAVSSRIHKVYESTARVKLEHIEESQTLVPNLSPEFGLLQNVSNSPAYTEATAVQSAAVLDPVIDSLQLVKRSTFLQRKKTPPRRLRADELASTSFIGAFLQQRALEVTPISNTDVIEISAYDTSLVGARDLVNAVTRSYVTFMSDLKRYSTKEGIQTLAQQLPVAERNLETRKAALRRFQEQHNVVNISAQSQSAVSTLSQLQNTLTETQRQLQVTQDRMSELSKDVTKLREPSEVTSQVESNPQIQLLLTRLSDLTAQMQAKLAVETRAHPDVRAVEQQIEDTKVSLQREVQRIFGIAIADLKAQIAQLQRDIASHRSQMTALPQQEVQLADLQRQVDSAQKQVLDIQTSMEAARAAQQLNLSNVTVLQWGALPDPGNPYYPNIALYTVIALLLGFLLGLGVVLLVDYLDQSYRTDEGAQAALQLPLAGGVRKVEDVAKAMHGQALTRSGAVELGYNVARLIAHGKKVLLVSSAVEKDGKSPVAAILATTLARRGLRTVLVDLDGHVPTQLSTNGGPPSPGVSGILFDGVAPTSAVVPTKQENLSVVPAGPRAVDVSTELDAPQLARALQTYRATFDAVVINGPTILPSGEVVVLSSNVDGALLVVGLNRTQAPTVLRAKRRLDDAGAPVLGLVTSTV
jgi:uncharacterized protein involved in exopolysaccharide biosynthesis